MGSLGEMGRPGAGWVCWGDGYSNSPDPGGLSEDAKKDSGWRNEAGRRLGRMKTGWRRSFKDGEMGKDEITVVRC